MFLLPSKLCVRFLSKSSDFGIYSGDWIYHFKKFKKVTSRLSSVPFIYIYIYIWSSLTVVISMAAFYCVSSRCTKNFWKRLHLEPELIMSLNEWWYIIMTIQILQFYDPWHAFYCLQIWDACVCLCFPIIDHISLRDVKFVASDRPKIE